MNRYLEISPKVKAALEASKPIIALESTIISHGMPYPQNVETALRCEEEARKNGAEPATIAIIGGKLCAGLSEEQIDYLGKTGTAVQKASRRDLPLILARKQDGATTVSATMIIAQMANIPVFATGGIGGVHRGAEITMDISADLEELSRTSVAVVCAGAKSILDLGLTLEYLETKGVPVIGYQTEEFPAFFTFESGLKVDYRLNSPEEIASAIFTQKAVGYEGGMLITNPIPKDYAMPKAVINKAIDDALKEAAEKNIKGKELTPFLLGAVNQITHGASLESNIKLVLNNVALAAQVALALSKIR